MKSKVAYEYNDINSNEDNKKGNKIKIIILIIIIILILLGIKSCSTKEIGNTSYVIGTGTIPGLSKEDIEKELQRKADKEKFSFSINSEPVFKNGKSEGNLRIVNPHYNTYDVDVTITLNSDNKTVFKSEKLKPNQYIENAKLSKELKKGKYPATATINAYDSKTENLLGTAKVLLTINVKN